jgi:hypothetical protein
MMREGFFRQRLSAKNMGSLRKRNPRSTLVFWAL